MSVYLDRIEISGVRSLNWSTGTGPGLVLDDVGRVNIVFAPNGVGKTSLVEALTLALTGEPRRRGRALSHEAIVHAGRPEGRRARVALRFNGVEELAWDEPQAKDATSLAALRARTAALLSTERSDPEVVTNLLRLTHLLPQGWGERFTDQEGSARWTLVERALDLEGVRAAVRAGQASGAVGKALAQCGDKALRMATEARTALERWEECARRWQQAREAASNAGALTPEELKAELDVIATEFQITGPLTLSRARTLVEERRASLRNALEVAERLHARREAADAQVAGAEAAHVTAEAALRRAEVDLAAASVSVVHAEGSAAQAELPNLRAVLGRAEAIEKSLAMRVYAAALDVHDGAMRRAEDGLSKLADAQALDAAVADAETALSSADKDLRGAHQCLVELERAHGEMSRLLRELRPHVVQDPHDPRNCPVCGTPVPAQALLDRLDARLGALGDTATDEARARHAAAETRLHDATSQARGARVRRDDAALARAAATRARGEAFAEIAKVREEYPVLAEAGALGAGALAEALRAAATALVPDLAQLGNIAPDDARRARDSAARSVLMAEEAVRTSKALPHAPSEALTLEVVRHRRELAQGEHNDANTEVAAADQRRGGARASRDALVAELALLQLPELANVRSEDIPAKLESARSSRTTALDAVATRLDAVQRGAEAYARIDAVRLAEDALRTEVRAAKINQPDVLDDSWIGHTTEHLLGRERDAQEAATADSQRIQTVGKWVRVLASELQGYEDECLRELDPAVDRFLNALAPTMRWRVKLDKYRREARTSVANAPTPNPHELLSEGEHTAVALAYLFAFHSRFPWSRWPALVLDDPFQAADVVRVGALLDLLRGMSVARGTQLFLTTHDPQLAEWASRKMKNAGLDTRLYELERTAKGIRALAR